MAHHVGTSAMTHLLGKFICLSSSLECTPWIIDSGATDHMVCSPSYFTYSTPVKNQTVKLPNGSLVPVTHIGSINFSSQFTLTNVMCVPTFHFNLISVSKLSQNSQYSFIFSSQSCVIQDLR